MYSPVIFKFLAGRLIKVAFGTFVKKATAAALFIEKVLDVAGADVAEEFDYARSHVARLPRPHGQEPYYDNRDDNENEDYHDVFDGGFHI